MHWHAAVDEFPGGVTLLLFAQPGAKMARFPDGYNQWRGRICVSICAPAQDGKANAEVLTVVADWFGLRPADVTLVSGSSTRRKKVVVRGVDWRTTMDRLEAVL